MMPHTRERDDLLYKVAEQWETVPLRLELTCFHAAPGMHAQPS